MAAPLMLAAGAIQAIGAIRQGNMAAEAANYNASAMQRQAGIVNAQATARQELQGTRARQQIGQQLAATSESGTALTGSNLDMLRQSLTNAAADSLNIRYGANLDAMGLNDNAALERARGSQARIGGYLNAAAALTSGGNSYVSGGGKLPFMNADPLPTTGDFSRMDRRSSTYYGAG